MSRPTISIVVIGKDEGSLLHRALASALEARDRLRPEIEVEVIYVDSGSLDDSYAHACSLPGVRVARIPRRGSSAARARNRGIGMARGRFVQLLDGDMELEPCWLLGALGAMTCERIAAVAGSLTELNPNASLWNRVFGLDWETSPGEVDAVGGAALWRSDALRALGGFDGSMAVGEDPELSLRAREAGYTLLRLESSMARHDLDLRSFAQYWHRAMAVGRSRAAVALRHRDSRWARSRLLSPLRGALLLSLAGVAALAGGLPGLLAAGMGLLGLASRRAYLDRTRGWPLSDALMHAVHVYLVKLPVSMGAGGSILAHLVRGGAVR